MKLFPQDVDVQSVLRSECCETQAHTMHGNLNEGISGFCAPCKVQHGQSGPKWAGQESPMVSITGALGVLVLTDTKKARLQRLELVLALVAVTTQSETCLAPQCWKHTRYSCIISRAADLLV